MEKNNALLRDRPIKVVNKRTNLPAWQVRHCLCASDASSFNGAPTMQMPHAALCLPVHRAIHARAHASACRDLGAEQHCTNAVCDKGSYVTWSGWCLFLLRRACASRRQGAVGEDGEDSAAAILLDVVSAEATGVAVAVTTLPIRLPQTGSSSCADSLEARRGAESSRRARIVGVAVLRDRVVGTCCGGRAAAAWCTAEGRGGKWWSRRAHG